MTAEWIRFGCTAFFTIVGMVLFSAAVLGANRFGIAMNRLHAAGIGDTAGLFFVCLGLFVAAGIHADTLKMALIVVFMWFTSPASSHFLSQIEYYTNPELCSFAGQDEHPDESLNEEE